MKKIYRKLKEFAKREEYQTGFLGRADGTVRVPRRNHWVYVRLWNGEIIEAFNNGVPAAFGLAVQVAYRSGRYYVAPRDAYNQPVYIGLPDDAEDELQWPGSHTLYVRPEQFLPGLIIPKENLTVIVCGGSLPLATGGYISVPTRELDLTPYRPTSNAIWVTLGWSATGTLLAATGGAANSLGELSTANIPSTGGYDLAAIKLFNGQTVISHGKFGSVIVDLRWFKPTTSSGGATWGAITGTLSDQIDLQNALDAKSSAAHAPQHKSGGADAIALDELAAPTDNTALNVSTLAHGLAPKLPGDAGKYLDGTGAWSVPSGGGGSLIFTNSDTAAIAENDVVILNGGSNQSCKLTMQVGDLRVLGVAKESIAPGAQGEITRYSEIHLVNVNGVVARGEWLITSSTAGRAMSSGLFARPTDGALGIALEAHAGGTGTILALLLPDTLVGCEAGNLYAVGGYTGTAALTDCDQYTPDTWTSKTDMPAPARYALPAGVIGSSLYAVGGYTGTARLTDCDQYTPDTWTSKTDMPAPARSALAAGAI